MALNALMNIDDLAVEGESQKDGFEKWIEVLSWSWGATQSGTTHDQTGSGSGKVNVQDFSFSKHVDKATPTIFQNCCTGKHFKKVELHILKADGQKGLPYLKYTFNDVIVSSFSTGGSPGHDDQVSEQVSINFARCKVDYEMQDAQGRKAGAKSMEFDIQKNKAP